MESEAVTAGSAPDTPGVERWRERVLHALLLTIVLLGAVAYVPSVWLAVREGLAGIVVLDTAVYALVLGVYLAPRAPYLLRASILLAVTYALGVGLLVALGPFGAGPAWILAVPPVAAILLDLRATVAAIIVTALTLLVVGHVYAPGGEWTTGGSAGLLVVIASNALVVDAMIAVAIAVLVRGLEGEAGAREAVNRELILERNRLKEANQKLCLSVNEQRRVEERLRHAEQLTTIGTLAGGIAHDFNNLLTPVITAMELLREGETDPERAELLASAAEAGDRGRDLVARILAFSRPSTGDREALDAAGGVAEACRLLRASLPGSVVIREDLDAEAGHIRLTPTELQQIILNLGSNALHAMRLTGGTLSIAVRPGDDGGLPPGPGLAPGPCVRITVTDTGSGMSAETQRYATEPFFTTRVRGEGTGLGLASVHGIVSGAGGTLDIRSVEGEGTTVEICMPRVDGPDERHEGKKPVARGAGEHILLVDDEASIRSVGSRFLERAGYRVTTAEDAAAALRLIRIHPEDVDLVLTDQSMPGTSGLELAREIHLLRPAMPVILVSGLVDDELRRRATAVGCLATLEKPFQLGPLTDLLHHALDRVAGPTT